MTEREKGILWANLQQAMAWDLFKNPEYTGKLDGEELHDLYLEATGDKEMAVKVGVARAQARQRAGVKP